jgi:hypothetical protein
VTPALGPPVLAVILFEVILNAMAMFNHANVRLPLGIDRALRQPGVWFWVLSRSGRASCERRASLPRPCSLGE